MNEIRFLPLLLILALVGCAYPIHKQLQPAALISVRDAKGRPVTGARVYLFTTIAPYGRRGETDIRQTDASGIAKFGSKREWRIEYLAMHGWDEFSWHWCVAKAGYETYRSTFTERFSTEPMIVLKEGVSEPCESPF